MIGKRINGFNGCHQIPGPATGDIRSGIEGDEPCFDQWLSRLTTFGPLDGALIKKPDLEYLFWDWTSALGSR